MLLLDLNAYFGRFALRNFLLIINQVFIMHKTDIVKALAEKTGSSQKMCGECVDGLLELITKSLKKGEDVVFVGFGSFKKTKTKARKGRNPQTGKEITIKASNRVKFSAGKALKEALN